MFPFLIHQGKFVIPTFSFMIMVASLAAAFYMYWRAPGLGLSQTVVLDIGIIGTIAAIVGARLFHVFVEAPGYYWQNPTHIYQIWRGGFVSYGGITLFVVSIIIYLKVRKLNVFRYFDLIALAFPIINFFVRIGCLGAGCCYGKPTHFFIHLIYRNPASDAGYKYNGIPLHATQIYDMLVNSVVLFTVLNLIDRKKKFDGETTAWFLILYGFMRGMIEFLRGDADRGIYFGGIISTAQIMGLLAITGGTILYFWSRSLAQKSGGLVHSPAH
jgi:phosphatidylglycerol:prolipoprotein diacylglycerol transferase